MFGQALNPIIRSDSSPRFAMFSTLTGAMANIILDPVFIYTLHWGMAGATVATVIGQILTAGMSITTYNHAYVHGPGRALVVIPCCRHIDSIHHLVFC